MSGQPLPPAEVADNEGRAAFGRVCKQGLISALFALPRLATWPIWKLERVLRMIEELAQ